MRFESLEALVAENERVSAAALVMDLLTPAGESGLLVDIGAGTRKDFAPYAAAGWEVLAFEPHPETRHRLEQSVSPDWTVSLDPRAIGQVVTRAPMFDSPSGGGSMLPPAMSSDNTDFVEVDVVTPNVALTSLDGRRPDLVLVSTVGWGREILRAYPWDLARPTALVIAVDDVFSERFGFRALDVASELTARGYEVFAIAHTLIGPAEAVEIVTKLPHDGASPTQLLAMAPGVTSLQDLRARRHGVIAERVGRTARHVLDGAGECHFDQDTLRATRLESEALRGEIEDLRQSTSWRIGHRFVVAGKSLVSWVPGVRALLQRRTGR